MKNYIAVYARDERSKGFSPIVPEVASGTNVQLIPLSGRHATPAGNGAIDGGDGGQQLPEVGRLVRHLAETHLSAWGTKLDKRLNLSKDDVKKLLDQMAANDAKYVAMRAKTYTMKESTGDDRTVGVGASGSGMAFSKVTGDKFADAEGLARTLDQLKALLAK